MGRKAQERLLYEYLTLTYVYQFVCPFVFRVPGRYYVVRREHTTANQMWR